MKDMKVRQLRKEEHHRTRKLWEEIFTEDTSDFLDYYYSVKTAENEIYVIEDQDDIVSMLHLNPYQMRIGNKVYQTHYIVAVATDEQYRRRGLMARLLNHAMQVMKDRGEPFTFLMPASETIYKPFGFDCIYEQKRGKLTGKSGKGQILEFEYATKEDCKQIAAFANMCLREYDVTTWRTEAYYKAMLAEHRSENGGILLAKQKEEIVGAFCFTKEGRIEIREPLFRDAGILKQAIYYLTGNETEEVLCLGIGDEAKPVIMAKVFRPEIVGDLQKVKVFLNEVV